MILLDISYPNLMFSIVNPMVLLDFSYPNLMISNVTSMILLDVSHPNLMISNVNPMILLDVSYPNLMISIVHPMILLDLSYQNLMFSIVNPMVWGHVPSDLTSAARSVKPISLVPCVKHQTSLPQQTNMFDWECSAACLPKKLFGCPEMRLYYLFFSQSHILTWKANGIIENAGRPKTSIYRSCKHITRVEKSWKIWKAEGATPCLGPARSWDWRSLLK